MKWKGTHPDWPLNPPFVHPKDAKLRPVKTHSDPGYRVTTHQEPEKEREPGEDG